MDSDGPSPPQFLAGLWPTLSTVPPPSPIFESTGKPSLIRVNSIIALFEIQSAICAETPHSKLCNLVFLINMLLDSLIFRSFSNHYTLIRNMIFINFQHFLIFLTNVLWPKKWFFPKMNEEKGLFKQLFIIFFHTLYFIERFVNFW